MRDRVEHLKQLGFLVAAIGIGDECDKLRPKRRREKASVKLSLEVQRAGSPKRG